MYLSPGCRKTPGGVFFTLVRKNTSDEERKRIFHDDRKIQVRKKKERQLQRIMETEARIREREDPEARAGDDGSETDQPAGLETTKDGLMQNYWKESISTLPKLSARVVGETRQEDATIEQRGTSRLVSSLGLDPVLRNGIVNRPRMDTSCDEAMEVCGTEAEDRHEIDEELLARKFDLTNEVDLDFGIDFG